MAVIGWRRLVQLEADLFVIDHLTFVICHLLEPSGHLVRK
jgi:hypothetical protein